jgi:hypothetical protein
LSIVYQLKLFPVGYAFLYSRCSAQAHAGVMRLFVCLEGEIAGTLETCELERVICQVKFPHARRANQPPAV